MISSFLIKLLRCPGILALGELKTYGAALEMFLQQIAAHHILNKNKAVEVFLTSAEVSSLTLQHDLKSQQSCVNMETSLQDAITPA